MRALITSSIFYSQVQKILRKTLKKWPEWTVRLCLFRPGIGGWSSYEVHQTCVPCVSRNLLYTSPLWRNAYNDLIVSLIDELWIDLNSVLKLNYT